MFRLGMLAALMVWLLGALPAPVAADGFMIVLNPTPPGSTTVSGAVRNVPGGTQTVKLDLKLKSGDVLSQTIDQYSNGNFLFKNVQAGSWASLRATAQGGSNEQYTEVGPEAATPSNGYGDGAYQGYTGPYYFPNYLGVNGSGYAYPGNAGAPSYGPTAYPGSYFYPYSYNNPYYSYPGVYAYPGYGGPGGTAYPGYSYPSSWGNWSSPYFGYPYGGYGYPGPSGYPYGGYGYPGG